VFDRHPTLTRPLSAATLTLKGVGEAAVQREAAVDAIHP
jgi:hypothetical protein